jgi:GNAT superfamily N-acetyltransferase
MPSLVIRPCEPRDREALIDQFWGLNRFEDPLIGNRRTDRTGAAECLDAALRRVEGTGGAALLAELDGRVLGHLFLTVEEDAVYVRPELRPYAYIAELFVREEARGGGIGTALMQEAERVAAARGLDRLMVGVLAGNARTEALYRRLGFAPAAIEMAKRITR